MKQSVLLLFLGLAISGSTAAQEISEQQARQIASRFFAGKGLGSPASLTYRAKAAESSYSDYYVFNRGNGGGYVIVSGDDRAYEVLGYSDTGNFNYADAPRHIKDFLDGYAREIRYIRQQPETKRVSPMKSPHFTPAKPLLGDIAWDQTDPYNLMTPYYVGTTHSATGCVATAMAQIMYYHRWPAHGEGSKTYTPATMNQPVSVDFSQDFYDWDAMLPQYDETASEKSRNAVALLMRDCGVAVNMAYGEQSGSNIEEWPVPLTTNFSYDGNIGMFNRQYYTQEDWDQIIRDEIDQRRPVFATGFTDGNGGHAFVFDGYDADGLIHVNWGWSGMSNGYFRTSALTPATQGTGGSAGGFNYRQGIIVGIQPPTADSEPALQIVSSEKVSAVPSKAGRSDPVRLRLSGKITNYGWKDATVDFAMGVYDDAGQLVKTIESDKNVALAVNKYKIAVTVNDADLSALSNGSYKVFPIVKNSDGQRWTKVRDYKYTKPNFLKLTVVDDSLYFDQPAGYNLVANGLSATKIYANTSAQIKANVKNIGEIEYNGPVKAVLLRPADGTKAAESVEYLQDISVGDSVDVAVINEFRVEPGAYQLALADENQTLLNTPVDVEVLAAPAVGSNLTMTSQLAFTDEDVFRPDSLTITAHVRNLSGVFANDLTVYVYSADESTVCGSLNPQFVLLDADESADVAFAGHFENLRSGTTYKAVLINLTQNTYINPREQASCLFTLGAATTGIRALDADSKQDGDSPVYNLAGQRVGKDYKGIVIKNGKKYIK